MAAAWPENRCLSRPWVGNGGGGSSGGNAGTGSSSGNPGAGGSGGALFGAHGTNGAAGT
ncbi:MAG: hypothetical protein ACLPXZ_26185 [Mycobacterium sp.]